MEFTNTKIRSAARGLLLGGSLVALSACSDGMGRPLNLDFDLRGLGGGEFTTADAAREARAAARPSPDARGVISYPTYQVAVARRGDTLSALATRVGLPEAEIARYNGLNAGAQLREGEVVALPRRTTTPGSVDVTTVAGNALDRIGSNQQSASPSGTAQSNSEPMRHQVASGETAYSIARLYGVSVRSLAEWNGLDSALSVRQGQFLMIPPKTGEPASNDTNSAPGVGTPTPLPPSSSAPLPQSSNRTASQGPADTPASPNLAAQRTSTAAMTMPADGRITGAYVKGKSDGIDIAAAAGSPVKAAQGGTVAAITRDTEQVPILVIRHEGNLLTVYAGIDNISVAKGATVSRGQTIAQVRASDSPALHFQVRQGTSSVDPMQYLN